MSRPPVKVRAGERFGKLVVLADRDGDAQRVAVRCDCGVEKTVAVAELRRRRGVRSCGCLSRQALVRGRYAGRRHGQAGRSGRSPLYELWRDLRRRYPGEVCKRWEESFETFARDLGPKPSRAHRLVRPRPDRAWSPRNAGWATAKPADQRGARNPNAKLTREHVDAIRIRRFEGVPARNLAVEFGISESHVYRLVTREQWR
jgi:predicted DNA-binding protein (UPF0251 family)